MKIPCLQMPWSQCMQVILALVCVTIPILHIYNPGIPTTKRLYIMHSHPAHIKPKPYTFPDGTRTLFPNSRLVALYGTPDEPVLGALGQQPLEASIARAKELAAYYQPLMSEHVFPALEIISTIASATPTENGTYSYPIDMNKLKNWVLAAKQNGVYVVLDLQPGRNTFLTQAEQYQSLLEQPNVGLALDPEWRLAPNEIPLQQIGTADIVEVNQTAAWLATLTRQHKLPQKLFLLHEFRLTMLPSRSQLDTSHPELAYAIQMDGQGSQAQKLDTWRTILADPPPNVYFGWKNFYALINFYDVAGRIFKRFELCL